MKWVWLLLIPLAGCVAEAPEVDDVATGQEPDAVQTNTTITPDVLEPETATPIVIPYNATGCDAVVFIHAVSFEEAQAYLPLGFVAADLGELLDIGVRLDMAALALVTFSCTDDRTVGGPVNVASVDIFVDPPVINGEQTDPDGVFINAYEVIRFTDDPAYVARYEAVGWTINGTLEQEVAYLVREPLPDLQVDSKQPNPLIATTQGDTGNSSWTGGITGGTTYHLKDRTSRFWHDTPAGISYDEYVLDRQGRGAVSGCTYDGQIAELMGRERCEAGESLGLGFQSFSIEGQMHHLPGVHA